MLTELEIARYKSVVKKFDERLIEIECLTIYFIQEGVPSENFLKAMEDAENKKQELINLIEENGGTL